jgi:hypothetical protein
MSSRDRLDAVRRAKDLCLREFSSEPWFRGAGVAKGEQGYILRVNVSPGSRLPDSLASGQYEGVPVEVIEISGYERRV